MRRPAELDDDERREDELVRVTLYRGRWIVPVDLPRWVAGFIAETVGQRKQAEEERDAARRRGHMLWLSGAYLGAGTVAVVAVDDSRFAGALWMLVGVLLWPQARERIGAAWTWYRERRARHG